jgi:hypothetical protein
MCEEGQMPIQVACQKCGTAYVFEDAMAGRPFTCPACGATGVVQPAQPGAAPMAATPAPQPQKTSGPAIWSMILGILSIVLGVVPWGFLASLPEKSGLALGIIGIALCGVGLLVGLPAMVIGIIAISKIRRSRGQTIGSAFAAVGIALGALSFFATLILAAKLLPLAVARARAEARAHASNVCANNLHQIGLAMTVYRATNDEFLPYDERGPLYSLSLLYPAWIDEPKIFVCPSVGKREKRVFPPGCSLAGHPCSYGYDNETHFRNMTPGAAIAADMPGNHDGGFRVLYYDGHISSSRKGNYCSQNSHDNIFAREPGWEADTDSYIRQ